MPRGTEPFPSNPDEFDQDDRISYSKVDGTYILVDENDEEWEFNSSAKRWFQPATEEQIAAYQQAYAGNSATDGHVEADKSPPPELSKKRKAPASASIESNAKKSKVPENRGVYVTNLPRDATIEQIDREFSKWGLIDEGVDGQKRIKMYQDGDGNFKGEALVVYFKKESVELAIKMMDEYWFRDPKEPFIRVQAAEMSYKKEADGDKVKKQLTRKERKSGAANRADLSRKLAEWSDGEEDEVARTNVAPATTNKWARVVILKNLFTPEGLKEDPELRSDIIEDMREDGEAFGTVTNVVVYDLEPEGVVIVRFKEASAAAQFIEKCNGRWFDGKQVEAKAATDNPKGRFKKSERYLNEDEEDELLESLINHK